MRDEALEGVVDYTAIVRLQRAYADVVNRRAWTELVDIFEPDAVIELDLVTRDPQRIVGPEALGGFIGAAIETFDFFEFVILNSHVELWPGGDRNRAEARVFMCELRRTIGETERNEAFGIYRDEYLRHDGDWRFARRRYRSMARFPAGTVFPLLDLP